MKILRIHLKNLNSLRGEWHIDFTDSEYTSDGIFAVTGPTGAGKTTIFDAVCLALYGQTPRLSIRNKGEIMSKHTKECLASVEIESDRKNYVFTWSYSRSGNKVNTIHTVDENGSPITDSSRQGDSAALAEKVTGLNFKQFTQTVLLAQGEFDAFLSGNPTERAKILELITGTGIYSEISKKIAEHTDKAKEALIVAKSARDAKLPNDELGTIEAISQEIARIRPALSYAESERANLEEAVKWLEAIRDIAGEIMRVKSEISSHMKAAEDFAEKRSLLDAGMRAKDVLPIFNKVDGKRKQYRDEHESLSKLQQEVSDDLKKLAVIETVSLPECEESLRQMTSNIPPGQTPEDIRTRVNALLDESMRLYRQKKSLMNECRTAEEKRDKAQAIYDAAKKEDEYCRQKLSETLKSIFDRRRRELKPGDICPLCGGVVTAEALHKFPVYYTDADNDDENNALSKSDEASKRLSRACAAMETAITNLEHIRKGINDCEKRRLEIRHTVTDIISPLGIRAANSCDEIIGSMEKWYSEISGLNKKIADLNAEAQTLRGRADAKKKMLEDGQSALEAMTNDIRELETVFMSELRAHSFADEGQFRASILDDARMSALQTEAQAHDDALRKLQGILDNREKKLSDEREKAITVMNLEEASPMLRAKKEKADNLRRRLITLENAEASRKKLQAEYDRLDAIYREKEKDYNNWEAFNRELGSKNGGKFSSFAQQITLRMLVQEANKQLLHMSSRYTLTMKEDSDKLELSVKDSEQAGEIRPTSNLSGGERFIISLALALGLSQISGSKAQVDSLFIDEGFGSLDDDSLSAALEALGEIRRDGRMIGIISHIQGISERIPTKINVIPKTEGTSIITGPGCSGGI